MLKKLYQSFINKEVQRVVRRRLNSFSKKQLIFATPVNESVLNPIPEDQKERLKRATSKGEAIRREDSFFIGYTEGLARADFLLKEDSYNIDSIRTILTAFPNSYACAIFGKDYGKGLLSGLFGETGKYCFVDSNHYANKWRKLLKKEIYSIETASIKRQFLFIKIVDKTLEMVV